MFLVDNGWMGVSPSYEEEGEIHHREHRGHRVSREEGRKSD
jgi:hypothetical protein